MQRGSASIGCWSKSYNEKKLTATDHGALAALELAYFG